MPPLRRTSILYRCTQRNESHSLSAVIQTSPVIRSLSHPQANTADNYNLIVVGSGFAGTMATLNFLETCSKLRKNGRVALVEAGKSDERCGASRWTMAYLRLDKNLAFDEDWKHEMKAVSKGEAD